jgi:hypothetical protein
MVEFDQYDAKTLPEGQIRQRYCRKTGYNE